MELTKEERDELDNGRIYGPLSRERFEKRMLIAKKLTNFFWEDQDQQTKEVIEKYPLWKLFLWGSHAYRVLDVLWNEDRTSYKLKMWEDPLVGMPMMRVARIVLMEPPKPCFFHVGDYDPWTRLNFNLCTGSSVFTDPAGIWV